jgi:methoxymalonate biosynthesis protein
MTAMFRPGAVKCVIWDLDNTLWRGTLLENDASELFAHRHELMRALDSRGVLQSVASRGDRDLAEERLRADGLLDILVAPQIGWQHKSESVADIVDGLGFAPDTFVLVDDDPFERADVASVYSGLICLAPDEADALLPDVVSAVPVTAEARARRVSYQTDARRRHAERQAVDRLDFERSLQLTITLRRAETDDLARCAELTQRTTQLNTTGRVLPERELRRMLDDPEYAVVVVGVSDRFGDYGTVGLAVLRTGDELWDLLLYATSCRVLSRGVGGFVLNLLTGAAVRAGRILRVDFVPAPRRRPMYLALRFAGFTPSEQGAGEAQRLVAGTAPPLPDHVRVDRGRWPWPT